MRTYYAFRKGDNWGCCYVGMKFLIEETVRPVLYSNPMDEFLNEAKLKGFERKQYQL